MTLVEFLDKHFFGICFTLVLVASAIGGGLSRRCRCGK